MGVEYWPAGLNTLPQAGEPQYWLLLTVEEAAQALRVSRSKVYMLLMHKRLFGVKVGAARWIPVKALEEYVEQLMALQKVG